MSAPHLHQAEVDFVLENYFIVNPDSIKICKQAHFHSHSNKVIFAATTVITNLKVHAKKCFKTSFVEKKRLGTLIQEYIYDVSLKFLLIWIIKDSMSMTLFLTSLVVIKIKITK